MSLANFKIRSGTTQRLPVIIVLIFLIAACGITPVNVASDDDRDSVLPRRATDSAEHARRLIAAGVEPLSGQNIAYTLDRLEAGLRRVFAGTSASIMRESERLLVRCPTDQVIDPQSREIRPEFLEHLESMADVLSQYGSVFLEIGVHTDSSGGQRLNYRASESLASDLTEHLLERNISSSHLFPVAFGESRLMVALGSATEREINNRVEFLFLPVTADK